MKKFICLLFAGMIAFSALGCGDKKADPKKDPKAPAAGEEKKPAGEEKK